MYSTMYYAEMQKLMLLHKRKPAILGSVSVGQPNQNNCALAKQAFLGVHLVSSIKYVECR